jgi:hypothetical protein
MKLGWSQWNVFRDNWWAGSKVWGHLHSFSRNYNLSCRLSVIQMSDVMVTIFIHICMHLYFHRRNFSTIFLQHLATIVLFSINTNSNSKVVLYKTLLLTPWSRIFIEKLSSQLVKKFPEFYGTLGLLPHSHMFATCPYPEPDRSNPYQHISLPEDPSCYYPTIYVWVWFGLHWKNITVIQWSAKRWLIPVF